MVKAIVFDCFGVLASDGWLPFKRRHFGHDQALMQEATDLNKKVDAGLADYSEFLHRVAELANVSYEEARRDIENNVPDSELFAYIKDRLKPRYKLGILSNAGADWLNEMFSSEQVALFDATALSYDTGYVKPDKRAYKTICERLGVESEESVFIDDQERYCAAARDFGMQAIWYKNFEQFREELELMLA